MPAPDSVLSLCETFAAHREHYRSSSYNETELRREFLAPLFKALGWDIDNEQGYADAYKDVIHDDAIKIGGIFSREAVLKGSFAREDSLPKLPSNH